MGRGGGVWGVGGIICSGGGVVRCVCTWNTFMDGGHSVGECGGNVVGGVCFRMLEDSRSLVDDALSMGWQWLGFDQRVLEAWCLLWAVVERHGVVQVLGQRSSRMAMGRVIDSGEIVRLNVVFFHLLSLRLVRGRHRKVGGWDGTWEFSIFGCKWFVTVSGDVSSSFLDFDRFLLDGGGCRLSDEWLVQEISGVLFKLGELLVGTSCLDGRELVQSRDVVVEYVQAGDCGLVLSDSIRLRCVFCEGREVDGRYQCYMCVGSDGEVGLTSGVLARFGV